MGLKRLLRGLLFVSRPRLRLTVGPVLKRETEPRRLATMVLVMKADEKTTLRVDPRDAFDNPASVDGAVAWKVLGTTPDVVTLTPAGDGKACTVVTTGKVGTCQVEASADADLGEGVRTITAVQDLDIRAAEADHMAFTADAPTKR